MINHINAEDYCLSHSKPLSTVLEELAQKTRETSKAHHMLIGGIEGSLFQFLISLSGAKKILEFGTYTGFSALLMAEALPEDGEIHTVDINQQTVELAKTFWAKSEHGKKIQSFLMSGLDYIQNHHDSFDLIFIDADKNNYMNYLKWSLEHLSEKGFIILDNTLWHGKVFDSENQDKQTKSIREVNDFVAGLTGYHRVLLPVRDGITLIKRDF